MDASSQPMASISVSFSPDVYSIDAFKKASYRFLNVCAIDIVPTADAITCTLNFISAQSDDAVNRIVNDFKIEVLDQDLRQTIADETASIRNAVLAYAFSKTGLQAE